jgi:hypothetical protein
MAFRKEPDLLRRRRNGLNGQLASGQVTASFAGVTMTRPAVFGSSHDKLNADKRLDKY